MVKKDWIVNKSSWRKLSLLKLGSVTAFKLPFYDRSDHYQLMSWLQMAVFRMGTSYNYLNHHLFTKLGMNQWEQGPCQTGSMTTSSADVPITKQPQVLADGDFGGNEPSLVAWMACKAWQTSSKTSFYLNDQEEGGRQWHSGTNTLLPPRASSAVLHPVSSSHPQCQARNQQKTLWSWSIFQCCTTTVEQSAHCSETASFEGKF